MRASWTTSSICLLLCSLRSEAQQTRPVTVQSENQGKVERSVMIRMRDGVRLSTDLYFPEGAVGKLPVILVRTPYGKNDPNMASVNVAPLFVGRGYVFVAQDMRGRYESEGVYYYLDVSAGSDGYDTLSWLAAQPWSNGKIGTFGCSAHGDVQIHLARLRHPYARRRRGVVCRLGGFFSHLRRPTESSPCSSKTRLWPVPSDSSFD